MNTDEGELHLQQIELGKTKSKESEELLSSRNKTETYSHIKFEGILETK